MKTRIEKYQSALQLLNGFLNDPQGFIEKVQKEKGLSGLPVNRGEDYYHQLISTLDPILKQSADAIMARLDRINQAITSQSKLDFYQEGIETQSKVTPLKRVGIYIPKTMPSSAYTYLSAIKAAGVREIVLFIAQGKYGETDPLTAYIGARYGAQLLTGPARVAFPVLAFGIPGIMRSCEMIGGPCGTDLNIIKNLAAQMGGAAIDMSAGPSDLSIIIEEEKHFEQARFDLMAQLEHGPDSTAAVILVGERTGALFRNWHSFESIVKTSGVVIHFCANAKEAAEYVSLIAPETLEAYVTDLSPYDNCLQHCGLVYQNLPSSIGDYAIMGRGCADPTGGFARGQSGISPLKFLKTTTLVTRSQAVNMLIKEGLQIAKYEGMEAHHTAIEGFRDELSLATTKER